MGFAFTVIYNIVIVGIFAKMAMHFGKWWIILFSLLAMGSYKESGNKNDETRKEDETDGGIEE